MKSIIEHVYWVPQANGGPVGQSAYHVQAVRIAEDPADWAALGNKGSDASTLSVTQCEAVGLDVAAIAEIIALDLAKRHDSDVAAIAQLTADREAAEMALVECRQESAALVRQAEEAAAHSESLLASRSATIEAQSNEIAELRAAIARLEADRDALDAAGMEQ